MIYILDISKSINDIYVNIELISNKYQDFKFDAVNALISNINKAVYAINENSLRDIKSTCFQFIKLYLALLDKKIHRLTIIRNNDIHICNNIEQYIIQNITPKPQLDTQHLDTQHLGAQHLGILSNISLMDIDLMTREITQPYNYNVSNIETVLINSDFSVNFNIHLKKFAKILSSKGLFNTYDPDEHSGINLKYYFNKANDTQGYCKCEKHCATKEKYPVCTKVTILIFRPGSIIITGSRNLVHLKSAHKLILKLLEENMTTIKINEGIEDRNAKNTALLNNEFRKMSRKPQLFYIKKNSVIISTPTLTQTHTPTRTPTL